MPQTWMQLSDAALEDALAEAIQDHHASSVKLLGLVAAVEARKLYLPAAYSSMFTYCVGRFGLTRDVAYKLIHAARAALRHPTILAAVEQGRLTVSAVASLARHLNPSNAPELLAWAEGLASRTSRRVPRDPTLP